MIDELKDHLNNAKDWEKLPTTIPGVFIVKVPGTKNRAARLMVEVNPVDKAGNIRKRKGIFIADFDMYLQFLEALQNDGVGKVIKSLDQVNPVETKKEGKILDIN